MKVQLRVDGFELVQGTHEGVENKIKEIAGNFPEDTIFTITIKRSNNEYKCEIRVQNGREFIRGEATGSRIEYSVSNAIKVLKKRVRKVNQMHIDKERNSFISVKDMVETAVTQTKEDWGIERVKNIHTPLINELDAIMYLEMVDHDFYVFKNIEKEGRVCVMYRRESGYGILVTE